LGLPQSSQSLDTAAADFVGLVPQVRFERSSHSSPNVRFDPLEVFDSFWGEDDVEGHSSQIIARFAEWSIFVLPGRFESALVHPPPSPAGLIRGSIFFA
jgi:hypothetical protein